MLRNQSRLPPFFIQREPSLESDSSLESDGKSLLSSIQASFLYPCFRVFIQRKDRSLLAMCANNTNLEHLPKTILRKIYINWWIMRSLAKLCQKLQKICAGTTTRDAVEKQIRRGSIDHETKFSWSVFSENLVAIKMHKLEVKFNKQTTWVCARHIQDNFITTTCHWCCKKCKVMYTDRDSLICQIACDNVRNYEARH